jgi:D-alanyl-D-alanine carboxypeptidase/D-alanyl-D-alanine-endopeptidase (penicillin-binding protein 4)
LAGSQRVQAKTGSLSHVNALSGYLQTKMHRTLAFSIMVNGTLGPESAVRDFVDRLCALFLDQ